MALWHWALLAGGGYLAYKALTAPQSPVITGGVSTPTSFSQKLLACCQKGSVVAGSLLSGSVACGCSTTVDAQGEPASSGQAGYCIHFEYPSGSGRSCAPESGIASGKWRSKAQMIQDVKNSMGFNPAYIGSYGRF